MSKKTKKESSKIYENELLNPQTTSESENELNKTSSSEELSLPFLLQESEEWVIEEFQNKEINLDQLHQTHIFKENFYDNESSYHLSIWDEKNEQYYLFSILDDEDENDEILLQKHDFNKSELFRIKKSDIKKSFCRKLFCMSYSDKALLAAHDELFKKVEILYDVNKEELDDILKMEEYFNKKHYKIGVLYAGEGQTTSKQYLSNTKSSQDFEEFLEILGDKIELYGWNKFKGGLDIKHHTCGDHSVYTEYKDFEIMFHISTWLPYNPRDPEQVLRKKHLGNDMVLIVFVDGNNKFDPSSFLSHQLHLIIAIKPVIQGQKKKYRVEISRRNIIEEFEPYLPSSPLFEPEELRDFLLTKSIKGERVISTSGKFLQRYLKMRKEVLKQIFTGEEDY
ncbi:rap gtpase-activating protein [Anaeramoeba flamelloides]|uniref:Rap gtpase-activating protein n=1 Tax=Anaeramoeba flamelloides TaxID=1746091 RepID=A0ABQ8YIJ3_9EUKA|nr:rap gtpase-activating protein [Anaeramoeba flamelloides]